MFYRVLTSVCVCVCVCVLQGANQWYELQDLHVQDLLPQMITLAEAYIQVSILRVGVADVMWVWLL